MTTTSSATSSAAASREPTPTEALASLPEGEKPKISPAERWLKIREKACLRAQKHGFVGGNLSDDWSKAEKEVDAKYDTDPDGESLTAPEQTASQIKCILDRFGLGDIGVDALLKKHKEGMERLAALNHTLIGGTADLASRQTALAQDALYEAMNALQSVAHGKLSKDEISKQAALSAKIMGNALSHLKAIAGAVTGTAKNRDKDKSPKS